MSVLALRLPAEVASVETARLAVLGHLPPGCLSPRERFDLELVLEELIMNLTLHAYRGAAEPGWFDLSAERLPGGVLRLVLEDDGADFDAATAVAAPAPASLEAAPVGGLGLVLVRQRALRLAHQRKAGRNRLEVDLACGAAAVQASSPATRPSVQ